MHNRVESVGQGDAEPIDQCKLGFFFFLSFFFCFFLDPFAAPRVPPSWAALVYSSTRLLYTTGVV